MTITVHRGTHQIGGCVTEIATDTTRIFIDFGSELPGPDGQAKEDTLPIPGVTEGEVRCDGVFFTHAHGDHIGSIHRIMPGIDLYMGEAAKRISLSLNEYLQKKHEKSPDVVSDRSATLAALREVKTFKRGVRFPIGDIWITPYRVDHSAFDAYMFVIEAEGIRLLHTGDFRSHGFTGKGLEPVLKIISREKTDWLITEGTMLSRPGEPVMTEYELYLQAKDIIRKNKNVCVLCSSTNIDRIAAFCSAARSAGRVILCDDYQKGILDIVQDYDTSEGGLYTFRDVETYRRELAQDIRQRGFVTFIRVNYNSGRILKKYGRNCKVVYSMWKGYLEGPVKNQRMVDFLEGYDMESLHTSGHATAETLLGVYEVIDPRKGVIPIHGEKPENFRGILPDDTRIETLHDGQTLTL